MAELTLLMRTPNTPLEALQEAFKSQAILEAEHVPSVPTPAETPSVISL